MESDQGVKSKKQNKNESKETIFKHFFVDNYLVILNNLIELQCIFKMFSKSSINDQIQPFKISHT